MASTTSRPEGLVAAVSTIKEAVTQVFKGNDPISGQPIYEEVPVSIGDAGFNNRADLVEELKQSYDGSSSVLVLRGVEGGPGITVELRDADDVSGTNGKKIVISSTTSQGVGEVNTASNIGTGTGLYATKSGADLQFKSLKSAGSVTITSDSDSVTISSVGEVNVLSSVGSGASLVGSKTGETLQVKSILPGAGIQVLENADNITIVNTNNGEANTASTLGTGIGVFANKNGVDLRFKSIAAGSSKVSVTEDSGTITIDVPEIGEVNHGLSLGTGHAVYAAMQGNDLAFKSLNAGNNVTLTSSPTGITIDAINLGEVNDGININALDPNKVDVFAGKTGTDFRFRRIAGQGSVSVSQDAGTIYIAGTGEANAAKNLGSVGSSVFAQKNASGELEFRRLIAGTGVTLTENANDITISSDAVTNGGENVGVSGANVFAGMSSTNLQFRRIIGDAATGVTVSEVGDQIKVSVSSSGEANNGANIGTLGESVFAGKSGVTLQFKNIAAASNKAAVSTDANNNILVDVNEASLSIDNLGGTLPLNKLATGSNTQVLTMVGGVPTWTNPAAVSAPVTSVAGKTGDVTLVVGDIGGLGSLATKSSIDWNSDVTNKPTLFSGSYNDLSDKPALFDGTWASLSGKPVLFSGSYTDLTDKPTIPTTLAAMTDVDTTGATTGSVLKYDQVTGKWKVGADDVGAAGSGVSQVASSSTAITVANGTGPTATLTFNAGNVNLSDFAGNLPNNRVTGLGSAALSNTTDFAAASHTHSALTADGTGYVDVNGVKYNKGNVAVGASSTTTLFTLPSGTEMAVVDYYIVEGANVQAGTITFVKVGSASSFTDTGTASGTVATTFAINGSGIDATAGSSSATIKFALRAF